MAPEQNSLLSSLSLQRFAVLVPPNLKPPVPLASPCTEVAAPAFLKRFVAGGTSIALQNPKLPSALCVRGTLCDGSSLRSSKGKTLGWVVREGLKWSRMRDSLSKLRTSEKALLKIDFKNAFNLISRQTFAEASAALFPKMAKWTHWCYGEATMLLYDHHRVIDSSCIFVVVFWDLLMKFQN